MLIIIPKVRMPSLYTSKIEFNASSDRLKECKLSNFWMIQTKKRYNGWLESCNNWIQGKVICKCYEFYENLLGNLRFKVFNW